MSEKAMFKGLFLRKNEAGKTEKRQRKRCGKISGKKSLGKNRSAIGQKRDLAFPHRSFPATFGSLFIRSPKRFFP
jgi:hypothetical protein